MGRCESYLRNAYNVPNNGTLIIYKIDYYIYDFLIPITEYQVFYQRKYYLLDLNYCENQYILIQIPVSINENEIYKYNPYSEYYNNSCYPSSLDCDNNNDLFILYKRKYYK